MDKREYREFIEKIKNSYEAADYDNVVEEASDFDVYRIREPKVLEMIAESYEKLERYDDAMRILRYAYEKMGKTSKQMAYQLGELAVMAGDLDSAVDFYQDFIHIAPGDKSKYLLKYKIGRTGGVDIKLLIPVLAAYVENYKEDQWEYELARLYHEAGNETECVKLCDDIFLWFGDGEYIKKALELKFMHTPLSPDQQKKYEEIMAPFMTPQPVAVEPEPENEEMDNEAEAFASELLGETKKAPEVLEDTKVIKFEDLKKEIDAECSEEEPAAPEEEPTVTEEVTEEPETQEKQKELTLRLDKLTGAQISFDELRRVLLREQSDDVIEAESEPEEEQPLEEETTAESVVNLDIVEKAMEENNGPVFNIDENKTNVQDEPKKMIHLSEESAEKIGVEYIFESPYAKLVTKPELGNRNSRVINSDAAPRNEVRTVFDEPRISENVDVSNIPLSSDEDGQIGLNLELMQNEDTDVSGQMSIDDIMAVYEKHIEEHKDEVAAVEAERLKQIQQAVESSVTPTPLYDLDFDSEVDGMESFSIGDDAMAEADQIVDRTDAFKNRDNDDEVGEDAAVLGAISAAIAAETASAVRDAKIEMQVGGAVTDISGKMDQPDSDEEFDEELEGVFDELDAELGDDFMEEEPDEAIDAIIDEVADEIPAYAEEEILEVKEVAEEAPVEESDIAEEAPEEEEPLVIDETSGEMYEEPVAEEAASEVEEAPEPVHVEEAEEVEGPVEESDIAEEAHEEEQPLVIDETSGEMYEEPESVEPELSDAEKAIAAFDNQQQENPEELDDMFEMDDEIAEMFADDVLAEEEATEQTSEDAAEAAIAAFVNKENEGEASDDDFDEFDDDFAEDIAEEAMAAEEEEEAPEAEAEPVEETAQKREPYEMSEEIQSELAEFLLVDGMHDKICQAVDSVLDRKLAGDVTGGNLVITGDAKSGKTYLALSLIKIITEETGKGVGKVAKVQAAALNGKDLEKIFEKIADSDLIIENIGYLDDETLEDLANVINSGKTHSMVVIEGNQLAVENIFNNFPQFNDAFASRIDISELSIVQWAEIACDYAKEQGYSIDDMALLALHAKINEIDLPSSKLSYNDIIGIVDDAIEKAEKRNVGKIFAAFSKKKDDEVKEIIEADFIK